MTLARGSSGGVQAANSHSRCLQRLAMPNRPPHRACTSAAQEGRAGFRLLTLASRMQHHWALRSPLRSSDGLRRASASACVMRPLATKPRALRQQVYLAMHRMRGQAMQGGRSEQL